MTAERYHFGRSWSGTSIEDECNCIKAPCGLVSIVDHWCPDHAFTSAKTMCQSHPESQCPGVSDG